MARTPYPTAKPLRNIKTIETMAEAISREPLTSNAKQSLGKLTRIDLDQRSVERTGPHK